MSKGGRKGRVSNELVAASCAAILAVYAAGYWRTRDEARRLDTPAQPRRAARPVVDATPVAVASPQSEIPVAASKPSKVVAPTAPPAASAPEAVKPAFPAAAPEPEVQVEATPAAVVEALPEPPPEPAVIWRDGTYTGWGLSRHGDIEARVTIRNGGIVAVGIATCATRYPCSVLDEILQQPLFRQSADVDRVSRATESADAYSDAVWQALQKAEAMPDLPASSP